MFSVWTGPFFPPIRLMAKQVWAEVMNKLVVRQKKEGRNGGVRGIVIGGEIQTHDTCKHGRDRAALFQILCN